MLFNILFLSNISLFSMPFYRIVLCYAPQKIVSKGGSQDERGWEALA